MKKILLEYSKIIGYTITGFVFGLSFFLLFLNFYHFNEVNSSFVKSDSDLAISNKLKSKIELIHNNSSLFNVGNYQESEDSASLALIKSRLDSCVNSLNNQEAFDILNKKVISITDVYELEQLYQNEVVNECLIKQLYNLTEESNNIKISSLNTMAPFFKTNIDSLSTSTEYVRSSIKNNSSYSFNSNSAKLNILDTTKDSYYQVVDSYNKAINFVLDVSSWYKEVLGG